jgi:hypothetical protein
MTGAVLPMDSEVTVSGTKYVVVDTLGQGGTSYVVSAAAPDGSIVALKVFNVFLDSRGGDMPDKILNVSRMLAGWTCSWIV